MNALFVLVDLLIRRCGMHDTPGGPFLSFFPVAQGTPYMSKCEGCGAPWGLSQLARSSVRNLWQLPACMAVNRQSCRRKHR